MIDVSIVIVSYNVRDLLEQCLNALAVEKSAGGDRSVVGGQWPAASREIIVVDNASQDGSAGLVRERFPSVRLIENSENRGFAAANNQAFVQSCGRYVLMLNPDAVAKPDAVEALAGFMDDHAAAGACGAMLRYPDGSLQHSAFGFPTLAQVFLDFFPLNWRLTDSRVNGRYPRRWYARGEPFAIDHPLGAALMVRREAAAQVGWLDERFFIYCEEIDWCLRIKRAGWQVWCVPQALIIHYEAQSTRQFRDAMFVELWRSRFRLFAKHYPRPFQWSAGQIVRAGLANEARRVRRKARAGLVTQDELVQRLAAYRQVSVLARGA